MLNQDETMQVFRGQYLNKDSLVVSTLDFLLYRV